MKTVDIEEAKADLPRLVAAAVQGEIFVIAEDGKPLVKVEAVPAPAPKERQFGFMKGEITIPEDFDTMCAEEIEQMFYGDK